MTLEFSRGIDYLLDMGFSLIPTRDDKRPFNDWAKNPKMSPNELADSLFKNNATSVAVRLGSQSGGLVCLDLDEKHYIGFSKLFLKELASFGERFRLESTPSGGFHIFYRVDLGEGQILDGTKNVAYREATKFELKENPKQKKYGFLEVRGEGGLCQTYPSTGYTVLSDVVPPILSWEEHQKIFVFCCTFNEVLPQEREVKIKKSEDELYDENPYVHFDKSNRGEKVLEEFGGWIYRYAHNGKDLYSKPGNTDKSIHAWFNHEKRFYNIFTTNSDIDQKGYSPSNLLARIRFNDDKKQTYAWLVENGFGKFKSKVEENIIRRKVMEGKELPANISDDGRKKFEEENGKLKLDYPFGIFWNELEDGRFEIDMEMFYSVSFELGFRKYNEEPVKIDKGLIFRCKDNEFFDELKTYIKSNNTELLSTYEKFLQKSGKFSIFRLREIDKKLVFRSNKHESFKFFKNCYVKITKDEVTCLEYSTTDRLIWFEDIRERDFSLIMEEGIKKYEKSLYYDFLNKAIGVDKYLLACIGYLLHKYKDQEGYFMLATEACEDSRKGGGSGKNIFCHLLSLSSTYKSTAGSQIKNDSTFMQSWNGESVYCMSDLPPKFNLLPFKDLVTDGSVVKKLYKNEAHIPVEDMPKLLASTNYSFDDADPGIYRRIRQIEFTDFFTRVGGVRKHYGKMFPYDWTKEDYHFYDNFVMECIQVFLHLDCYIEKKELTLGGWNKKFDLKYKHLRDFINQNINEWKDREFVSNETFKSNYELYCKENEIKTGYQAYTINLALEDYCEYKGIFFDKAASHRENNVKVVRGRAFSKNISSEPETIEDLPF